MEKMEMELCQPWTRHSWTYHGHDRFWLVLDMLSIQEPAVGSRSPDPKGWFGDGLEPPKLLFFLFLS